jgi:aminoglycoside 3-N-acetyltransferase I
VIGGLTVYLLHHYVSPQPIAYIYDVGVMPNYQSNGIGKKLIDYLSQYCREKGIREDYVEAETDDMQAVNFYRTTPISSELQATHFTYTFDNETKTYND